MNGTIPFYYENTLLESYIETLLRKSELTKKEIKEVMKTLEFFLPQIVFVHHY